MVVIDRSDCIVRVRRQNLVSSVLIELAACHPAVVIDRSDCNVLVGRQNLVSSELMKKKMN